MSAPGVNPVREAILVLAAGRGPGRSICPSEAARALSPANWRKLLPDVRAEAIRLHKAGLIQICRKGRPVEDPDTFRGVYRLGLPPAPASG